MTHEILQDADKKFKSSVDFLKSELATLRSSHTSPALVEDVMVQAYDGNYPLKEMAAISVPEPNTILIQPWDHTIIPNIQNAILQSESGLTPNVDGNSLRINVPALSQERRQELIKRVNTKAEEARIAVRNIRQDKMKAFEEMADVGKISEDERDRCKKQVQTEVDSINEQIDEIRESKIKALQEI
ncbi:ribosome recycling factor [candidate division WWE3 bacterium]|nr:ribosome recycling factor [candidate division WWE3 bacterium]